MTSLASALERHGRFSSPATAHIVASVGRAMRAAHDVGVVHRDLKPDNIFLHHAAEDCVVVKVLDFGLSKMLGKKGSLVTKAGVVLGTPAYMSPEQMLW